NAADVRRALLVEEDRAVRCVLVATIRPVTGALEDAERHESVEEVVDAPGMEADTLADLLAGQRSGSQMREDLQLDGGQNGLRGEEPHPDLHDVRRIRLLRHCGSSIGSPRYSAASGVGTLRRQRRSESY